MTVSKENPGQASLPTPHSTTSFWHSEPSKVLLGHRTTTALPTEADVIIIGSGISGASAVHFLREDAAGKDLNIVMLEAREACWGATGRNGGHCQPLLYLSPPDIGGFELRNYQTIKSLIAKHNIPCDWRSLTGVHAYMSHSMFATGLLNVEALQQASPELAKQITVITPTSQNPSLADLRIPNAAGAFIQANAASLWPYKLVSWLLETLLSQNDTSNPSKPPLFNLQTTTPVTRLQHLPNGSWIVHTPRGMIASKKVLLTTNAYTSHLIPQFSDLIVPVKGEMSALLSSPPSPSTDPPLKLNHTYVFIGHGRQNINQDDYLVQRPSHKGGELMFGGGRSEAPQAGVGNSDDSTIDSEAAPI